ncbi:MAG: bifunctional phosphoribosylaminoimidazolecarboxamide formyltransferase/IMP cyclohydrolase [Planctomycetota bacterium]
MPAATDDRSDTSPMPPARVTRALLSVSDKSGLIELAKALHRHGAELISTGGTARAISDAGLPVTPIDDVTGFPEMLDGRVKTLHPNVHGGLLGRRDLDTHVSAMRQHNIEPIDLVCVNLYPFEATVADPDVSEPEAIEQIDIGGPSMIRSGAKNHASVTVVTEPSQYAELIAEIESNGGATSFELRRRFAIDAFRRTAAYDAAISNHLGQSDPMPARLNLSFVRQDTLRYGENPHQSAAVYATPNAPSGALITAKQLHGKALSYNNLNDANATLELVRAMHRVSSDGVSAAVVKHTNPCGAATSSDTRTAVDLAIAGDPMAAFGGILAVSAGIDRAAAERIAADGTFFEVVIASSFDADAADVLMKRWKNVRLLEVGHSSPQVTHEHRFLPGGLLVQERDLIDPDPVSWTHAAGPKPDETTLIAGATLVPVCRALSSNAVLIGGENGQSVRLFGAGAGQMDRVASCLGAVRKSGDLAKGAIAVSDAFFPFPDGPEILIDAGVATIVHPGGSKNDQLTFDLCDRHGITCLTTGVRHFRH